MSAVKKPKAVVPAEREGLVLVMTPDDEGHKRRLRALTDVPSLRPPVDADSLPVLTEVIDEAELKARGLL
jgi:hypothetical protein